MSDDPLSLDTPAGRAAAFALGVVFVAIAAASAWWGFTRLSAPIEEPSPAEALVAPEVVPDDR